MLKLGCHFSLNAIRVLLNSLLVNSVLWEWRAGEKLEIGGNEGRMKRAIWQPKIKIKSGFSWGSSSYFPNETSSCWMSIKPKDQRRSWNSVHAWPPRGSDLKWQTKLTEAASPSYIWGRRPLKTSADWDTNTNRMIWDGRIEPHTHTHTQSFNCGNMPHLPFHCSSEWLLRSRAENSTTNLKHKWKQRQLHRRHIVLLA